MTLLVGGLILIVVLVLSFTVSDLIPGVAACVVGLSALAFGIRRNPSNSVFRAFVDPYDRFRHPLA